MLAFTINFDTLSVRVFRRLADAKRMAEPNERVVARPETLSAMDVATTKLTALYNSLRPNEPPKKKFVNRQTTVEKVMDALDDYALYSTTTILSFTPGEATEPKKPGRVSSLTDCYIYPTEASMAENPRREGSNGWRSMEILRKNPGMIFQDYIAAGGRAVDLRWDILYKHSEITREKLQPMKVAKKVSRKTATEALENDASEEQSDQAKPASEQSPEA